jgi:hydroxylamine reductase
MKEITEDMTFIEVMEKNREAAFLLMESGLMCAGCPMAGFETIKQGCEAHGVDVEDILRKLNKGEKDITKKIKSGKKKGKR